MPKKSFYLSEDELKTYERAKELAGESLSAILNQCLKAYVNNKENQEKDMSYVVKFIGEKHMVDNVIDGESIKFVGRFISKDCREIGKDEQECLELYYTRKGKYLLYWQIDNAGYVFNSGYKVYNEITDLYSANLTPKLIADVEKMFREVPCRELDV